MFENHGYISNTILSCLDHFFLNRWYLFIICIIFLNLSPMRLGKSKLSEAKKNEPSTEELHSVVSKILKEVDFNTVSCFRLDDASAFDSFFSSFSILIYLIVKIILGVQATLADILRQLGMNMIIMALIAHLTLQSRTK